MKHTYEVNGKHFGYRIQAETEQARVATQTGIVPAIIEHFEDGSSSVLPREQPRNFIGTKADEYERLLDEQWNQ